MRLIDADALLEKCLKSVWFNAEGCGKTVTTMAKSIAKFILKQEISKAPTTEAKPVVHAHWKHETWAGDFCSNCGNPAIEGRYAYQVHTNYCPHCGAQMDEVATDINVGSKGVKIPVINIEDVPKIMEEMEK